MSPAASEQAVVDTNVFVYSYDPSDPRKRGIAQDLVDRLALDGRLAVSVQTLNEFYWSATRPNKQPSLAHEDAWNAIERIAAASTVLPLSREVCLAAIRAVADHQLALWDALIWAVARENGIALIYTEDVPGKDEIEGVRYVNPFAPGTP